MVKKCIVVSFVALAMLSSFCDAQWRDDVYRPSLPKYPRPAPRGRPVPRTPGPIDPQQSKQTLEQPLTWKYPEDPKPDVKPQGPFELSHPVAVASVAVACTETNAHVEVKMDFFGIGQLINAADITLGECGVTAVDNAAQVLIFTVQLQDCGSSLAMTEDALIYTFNLNYNPQPLGAAPVLRTNQAAVIVECYYPRKQNVSSLPLDPLWVPFSAVKVAEEFLYFTLKLMTDDWQSERPSYQYFLGDMINIQAVVKQYFHVPLRIYVDSCVATLTPDTTSTPRYTFIDNNGCLIDAKITGSTSKFLARTVDNMLQFQMEAFRFQGDNTGVLYITCQLIATSAVDAVDSEHRSCSYINGMWREASGADAACSSCDSGVIGPPGTGLPGSSGAGVPGSSGTGVPGSSGTGVPGSSGTGVPGSSGTGVPGSSGTGVPGSSGTGVPGSSGTGVPGYPGTDVPGSSGTGVPAFPGTGVPSYPGTGVPAYPGTGVPAFPGTGVPGSSGTGVPAFPGTGVPAYPGTALPGSSGTGVPAFPGTGVPKFPGTGVPGSSGTGVPAYPGTGVSAFPGTGVPGSSGTGVPAYPGTGVSAFPGTGVPGSSGTRVPAFPGTGVPGSSGTGLSGSSGTGVRGSSGTGVSVSYVTRVPVYPGIGVPGSSGSGVPAYPGTGLPSGGSGTKNPYRTPRSVSQREIVEWQGQVTLGPFHIEEKV